MKIISRISAVILVIAVIGLISQPRILAKDIKLHDINGSLVDPGHVKSIDQPRRSSDGRFWILTVYLQSQAGPMAIKFQYPPEKGNLARQDYEAIKRGN